MGLQGLSRFTALRLLVDMAKTMGVSNCVLLCRCSRRRTSRNYEIFLLVGKMNLYRQPRKRRLVRMGYGHVGLKRGDPLHHLDRFIVTPVNTGWVNNLCHNPCR